MVEIAEYKATWPLEFEELACVIGQALGQLALRIDHVGSTAIPNLCAKDVIDVQVTVSAIDSRVSDAFSDAGFLLHTPLSIDHVPPGMRHAPDEWSKLLFKNPSDKRRAHIHVRRLGALNQRYALLFRDFLRANPPTAAAYGELKRRLAASLADPGAYPEVKDPAADLIYFAAEQWARSSKWDPNVSTLPDEA
jgi:GrpB-like predicted nucleotidyltransferase (UPF0157 family)